MYVIETIEPKSLKRKDSKIFCDECGLQYRKDEYDILRKNKKLIYFSWDTKREDFTKSKELTLCHGCLFKIIKKIHPNEKTKMKVLTPTDEYDLEFDPNARLHDDETESDDFTDFFG